MINKKNRRNRFSGFMAIGLSIVLFMGMLQATGTTSVSYVAAAETTAQLTPGFTHVNVREAPNLTGRVLTQINGGQALVILDQPDSQWYHVRFTQNGQEYIGYVSAQFVSVNYSDDGDFEAYMAAQGFPESYKPYLRDLHAQHPNWKFVAVQTNLDWNTVVENERNKQGQIKNLIYGGAGSPHYNWRETSVGYNWEIDKWYPYDGTTWFAASRDIVAYYMDPRTYLYETYVFAFEQLSYDSSVHNQAGVEAILAGTFMANSCPRGESRTFSAEIMEAAAAQNVSPYHLASRMRQEMGTTAGVNATGTSPNYPGIFNFFNVGSVDSAGGGAVNKGLAWASLSGSYGRPWNSAYKAIVGGAQFVGSSYIKVGQDTLYTQKFNVTNRNALFQHQYMSNVQAAATEAASMCKAYKNNGLINSALVFKIPVYNNMTEQATVKPPDSGSPNNWLNALSVSGYSLTPTFSGGTTDYNLIVENSVGSLNISASTVSGSARISGTGTIGLQVGTNVIPIRVTAQNGSVRTYNLTVIRKDGNGSVVDAPTLNTNYTVNGTTITGVGLGTGVSDFAAALGAAGSTVTVYKADGVTVNTGAVGTGNIVKVSNGATSVGYTVVIYGDVSGDGVIGVGDLVSTKKYLLSQGQLSEACCKAADVDRDGAITVRDLVTIKKHILGQQSIAQ